MNKLNVIKTISVVVLIQAILILLPFTAKADDFGNLVETLGTAPVSYSNVATEEYLDHVFNQENVIADGEWHAGTPQNLIDWSTHTSTAGNGWEKGFWGLYKGSQGQLMMADFLYNEGCYIVARFLASTKGITWNSNPDTNVSVMRMPSQVPVPGAVWLFGTAIIGLISRRKLGGVQ